MIVLKRHGAMLYVDLSGRRERSYVFSSPVHCDKADVYWHMLVFGHTIALTFVRPLH